MYINPFIGGVLATILAECVILLIALFITAKNDKGEGYGKDEKEESRW